ncbi:MAG: hypothetical protein HY748_00105 [Elusimicrobia bacterium]|nr:hypothetical protein [Elusimicrobiota bacterium]
MTEPRLRLVYCGLMVAALAVLACWRLDLVEEAFSATLRNLQKGGWARWHILAEIVLFSGILALTWRAVPLRLDPVRDLVIIGLAACVGWVAEAWGTREGLWAYYTGERPPLWIVPAWPLGALVVDRLADAARRRWGGCLRSRDLDIAYRLLGATCLAVCAAFALPWLGEPKTWAVLAALAAAVAARPEPDGDFWVLATGLACVFLADVWGTTNNCWRYYPQAHGGLGLASGIAFGIAFDGSLVLGCLKLANGLSR